jgi:hypothetical protein
MGVASMKKWYFGVALVAGWLCQTGTASAQIPTPFGAARIPEPIPCANTPELVPGPISPQGAPPGPPCGTDLPAGHTSAFQCEEFVRDDHCFAHFGAVGLMRQKLGGNTIAFQDPQNLDTGIIPFGSNHPTVQTYNDIGQNYEYGPKVTLGYLWQNHSIEVTGFWLPESKNSADTVLPGQVDQLFRNTPIGFEGNNGLWLQADRVNTEFRSQMWSAEVNYRYTNAAVLEAELILGVRYVDLWESLNRFTDDDGVSNPDPFGNPDPLRQAFYLTEVHNRIVAPQIGFEWGKSMTHWFTVGVNAKAALGVDFAEVRTSLTRGDGFVGFDNRRTKAVTLSQIYDAGAFLDFNFLERGRLRLGYSALFLVNVAAAQDQLDFNLANPAGATNNHGSIFYHGPMAELQFLF